MTNFHQFGNSLLTKQLRTLQVRICSDIKLLIRRLVKYVLFKLIFFVSVLIEKVAFFILVLTEILLQKVSSDFWYVHCCRVEKIIS